MLFMLFVHAESTQRGGVYMRVNGAWLIKHGGLANNNTIAVHTRLACNHLLMVHNVSMTQTTNCHDLTIKVIQSRRWLIGNLGGSLDHANLSYTW